ncbi:MAG: gluconate 2-dehydrogenase subunit 3 family protein [Actinobacteria bacterium]|nr:MAG: gluconate 2-dehydrogenase subunit 3 family protein [Actinomycetota bacterium]
MPAGIGRRAFVKAAGALGLLALLPPRRLEALGASALGPGQDGRFLTAHELDTLRAVTARFVPGPPDDPDPGALEAGVAEAIDLLLAAFTFEPPLIHAGGPFSDRAGATHDDFADFVPLDAHAELGWRIRIEGSLGIPQREFAGPVTGLQDIYRSGLAHLDDRSQQAYGVDFKDAPGPAQDLLLSDQTDGDLQTFVGAALANTLEAMYGPPEYGGNRDLVGWGYTRWPGDLQPRGSTDAEVSTAGPDTGAITGALLDDLQRFLPGLTGQRASRTQFWLGRAGIAQG